jgi:endonuclease YncB( thermonuclease family)
MILKEESTMSFLLIKGTFYVKGYQPDGDSIKFKADDLRNWAKLSGPKVKMNSKGHAQLRFEAIDALETHYEKFHQPMDLAMKATNFVLDNLGIKNVVWDEDGSVKSADDATRGYILTRSTDQYGRPVCFVFAGDPTDKDGSEVFLDKDKLIVSVNYRSAAEGLVYPTYYNGFFYDLRNELTIVVKKARQDKKGIWDKDLTNKGFDVPNFEPLMDNVVIMPKLFRRIAEYMGDGGSIAGFNQFLYDKWDPLIKIQQVHFTRLDNIVKVEGDRVTLSVTPENLIFIDPVQCTKPTQLVMRG